MKLTMTFPHRGTPPIPLSGYMQEPGDPFIHHQIWTSCLFHGISDCGRHVCALIGKGIDQNVCKSCKYRCPAEGAE